MTEVQLRTENDETLTLLFIFYFFLTLLFSGNKLL